MKTTQNEIRVSIMFILGIALFVFILVAFTKIGTNKGGYSIEVVYANAGGLTKGAPVRMSGIKVGNVSDVSIDEVTSKALVEVKINTNIKLYEHYDFNLGMGGIVGDRFVDIKPTEDNKRGEPLKNGDRVDGHSMTDVADLIDNANGFISELRGAAASLNELVSDENIPKSIHSSLNNVDAATARANQMMAALSMVVIDNKSKIDAITTNLVSISSDASKLSSSLATEMTKGDLTTNLSEAVKNAASLTKRADNIAAQLEMVTTDGKLLTDINSIVKSLNDSTARLAGILANVESGTESLPAITNNMNSIFENDVPTIINSLSKSAEKMNSMMDNLEKASGDLPEITGEIKEVTPEIMENILEISRSLKGAGQSITSIVTTVNNVKNLPPVRIDPDINIQATTGENGNRSDINFDLHYGSNGIFRAGVADFTNASKFNAQIGTGIGNGMLFRYGIVESSFGGGVDWLTLNERLKLSTELYIPSRFDANVTADFLIPQIGSHVWLTGGWYNVFSGNSSIGVGFKYHPTAQTNKKNKENKGEEKDETEIKR